MKPIPLPELAEIVHGRLVGAGHSVTGFATDSREVKAGDLFLAIKGENVDGHEYVAQAYANGAVCALVEHPVDGFYIEVPNLVMAIADIGKHFRAQFHGPVVGITGSAGKTSTKEFVAAALSPLGPVLKTQGNRNTEYTGPLMWAELDRHAAAVVEMGMRGFGQIAHLASVAQPTIGVITNIGFSHMELVGNREGVARAKSELLDSLPACGVAILGFDDDYFDFLKSRSKCPVKTFGRTEEANCWVVSCVSADWRHSHVTFSLDGLELHAELPAIGEHMALNAAAAILAAVSAGVDPHAAAEALKSAELPPLRMEVIEKGGVTIILDAYNASPPATIAALETMRDTAKGRKLAVLGEMRELGDYTEEAHRAVGQALAHSDVERAILIGPSMGFLREDALASGMKAEQLESAGNIEDIKRFLATAQPGDTVLVKGSRALELERAVGR